jgi:predicted HTH transcriptional regulator
MSMTYREDPLVELERDLKEGESQRLEFKERFPEQARDLAEVIASFATSNAGTVYLGIDDHARVVGVEAISGLQDTRGKDAYNKRIQGTTQQPISHCSFFFGRMGATKFFITPAWI